VLARAQTPAGLWLQLASALATGNRVVVEAPEAVTRLLAGLPGDVAARVRLGQAGPGEVDAVLVEDDATAMARRVAEWPGPIVTVQAPFNGGYSLDLLVDEVSISTNTAAAGGNASLMALV
jgi:RHH-type proline utilization regulon transcriptional repressor/proline dehydrogenase/delta 1-pyrroline-5-carboxylate dehydrogenase